MIEDYIQIKIKSKINKALLSVIHINIDSF